MDKIIVNSCEKEYFAIVEIKAAFIKNVPDYLTPCLHNSHIFCEANFIVFTKKNSTAKKIKFSDFKPKNAKDFDHKKFKYWLKLLICDQGCANILRITNGQTTVTTISKSSLFDVILNFCQVCKL